ncbi:F-box/kelch-repeat protein at1g57790 [Phtheirospermum japonicum]|uniref:F-box/kelch-repeat protein at1g57790 n=1 Tax=Phtheirospermum japonicum TaxID=374723 RepID=A0A830D3R8_9LAMI|nr:F-box/kelch-repeat protein at1g57790 [Phtheirospermum japonicum]
MREDWADLPEELLSLILSNLFANDRHSFSLACKAWNKAAKSSPFGQQYSPCLMYYHRSNRAWKIFQYNRFFSMPLPQHLNRADIRCAKHGWMLMSCYDLTMFFYDPFNNETIHLPKIDYEYPTLCFFHPPTSRDCFILGITNIAESRDVDIGVLRRGESKWSLSYNCTPVLHQGLLYFLDVNGNIATFDVDDKRGVAGRWVVRTKCFFPPRLCHKTRQNYLIRLHDEHMLLAVLVAHDERKVHVFKRLLEPNMKKWDPVRDLGDKVLFVSRAASFAGTTPRRSMANRIYFPKIHGGGDQCNVVFYSLDTQRYHSCSLDYSSNNSYGFKDLNFATWIMPTPTPEFPRDLTWCPNVDAAL